MQNSLKRQIRQTIEDLFFSHNTSDFATTKSAALEVYSDINDGSITKYIDEVISDIKNSNEIKTLSEHIRDHYDNDKAKFADWYGLEVDDVDNYIANSAKYGRGQIFTKYKRRTPKK